MSSRQLRVPARIDQFAAASAFVSECTVRAGVESAQQQRILLALEESFVNVALYAHSGAEGEVELGCGEEGNCFVLTLCDHGGAFDPLAAAPPDLSLSLEERPIGGMGIHLIRSVTESVSYKRVENCNVLRMVFSKAGADRPC